MCRPFPLVREEVIVFINDINLRRWITVVDVSTLLLFASNDQGCCQTTVLVATLTSAFLHCTHLQFFSKALFSASTSRMTLVDVGLLRKSRSSSELRISLLSSHDHSLSSDSNTTTSSSLLLSFGRPAPPCRVLVLATLEGSFQSDAEKLSLAISADIDDCHRGRPLSVSDMTNALFESLSQSKIQLGLGMNDWIRRLARLYFSTKIYSKSNGYYLKFLKFQIPIPRNQAGLAHKFPWGTTLTPYGHTKKMLESGHK